METEKEYPHYYKKLPEGTTHIDVYMVLDLFEVTDQTIGHAVKKLLCPGQRSGGKSRITDVEEAVKTLQRGLVICKGKEVEIGKETQQKDALLSTYPLSDI